MVSVLKTASPITSKIFKVFTLVVHTKASLSETADRKNDKHNEEGVALISVGSSGLYPLYASTAERNLPPLGGGGNDTPAVLIAGG